MPLIFWHLTLVGEHLPSLIGQLCMMTMHGYSREHIAVNILQWKPDSDFRVQSGRLYRFRVCAMNEVGTPAACTSRGLKESL